MYKSLIKVLGYYKRADIKITMIHGDNEFRSLEDLVEEKHKVEFNFLLPDEHVPDIERNNRTLAERY